MTKIWEAKVVKVKKPCCQVRNVSGPFYVCGANECEAACAAGVAILQSRHNVNHPYHNFAVNLSKGIKYWHDYTLLLEEKGKARPGVFSS